MTGAIGNLWQSAGTPETTAQVTAERAGCSTFSGTPHSLAVAGPWVYYWLRQGERPALWRTDGTASGTLQLAELQFGEANLMVLGDRVFFLQPADSEATRWEMWQSDGTPAGDEKGIRSSLGRGPARILDRPRL